MDYLLTENTYLCHNLCRYVFVIMWSVLYFDLVFVIVATGQDILDRKTCAVGQCGQQELLKRFEDMEILVRQQNNENRILIRRVELLEETVKLQKKTEEKLLNDIKLLNETVRSIQSQVETYIPHSADGVNDLKETITPHSNGGVTDPKETSTPLSNGVNNNFKEFLLMFLEDSNYTQSHPYERHISLLITADAPLTDITVECPAISLNTTYRIYHGMSNITVDLQALPRRFVVEKKGIFVRASNNITLYAFHQGRWQTEAFSVAPIEKLYTKYIVASYTPYIGSVAGITALESNTYVTVTLNASGTISVNGSSYGNGESFTIVLGRLGSFELFHTVDITGSIIESTKPISVTSGNICALRTDQSMCQRLTEQMLPVSRWGANFIVPSIPSSPDGYFLRIIPTLSNTAITLRTPNNGTSIYTANNEHFIDLDIVSNEMRSIYSIHPLFVSIVAKFSGGSSSKADPFMVTIPSINEYGSRYQVAIPGVVEFSTHYLIILINSQDAGGVLVDNETPLQHSTHRISLDLVYFTQVTISVKPGMHKISHKDNRKFGVIVVGYGYYTAYGYVAQSLA